MQCYSRLNLNNHMLSKKKEPKLINTKSSHDKILLLYHMISSHGDLLSVSFKHVYKGFIQALTDLRSPEVKTKSYIEL